MSSVTAARKSRLSCRPFSSQCLKGLSRATRHPFSISCRNLALYSHGRLQKGEIRLLEVNERNPGSREPSFSLQRFSLEETPPYTAISYTWGDVPPTKNISLNGQSIDTRPNLYACLDQLSRKSEWQHIWVDALCINQQDIEERNQQVCVMDQIFRKALTVTAWLGSAPKVDDGEDWSLAETFPDLARRPYWRRMWIVQELLLAREVQLAAGEHTFDFEHFKTLVSSAHKNSYHRAQIEGWLSTVPFLRTRDPDRFPFHRQRLLDLLVNYRHSQCGDSRDKVFSLLNLIPDEELSVLSRYFPDYSLSAEEVFAITLAFLRSKGQSKSVADYQAALTAFGAYTSKARFELEEASKVYDAKFTLSSTTFHQTFSQETFRPGSDASSTPRLRKTGFDFESQRIIQSAHNLLNFVAAQDWQPKSKRFISLRDASTNEDTRPVPQAAQGIPQARKASTWNKMSILDNWFDAMWEKMYEELYEELLAEDEEVKEETEDEEEIKEEGVGEEEASEEDEAEVETEADFLIALRLGIQMWKMAQRRAQEDGK